MIKFISVFLLFWSNDYNMLSFQPFHDERFPTLSENYGYLYYCTFKVLSKWFKKNFVFTCKTIDNSKVWGQLAIFLCCFLCWKFGKTYEEEICLTKTWVHSNAILEGLISFKFVCLNGINRIFLKQICLNFKN